MNPLKPIELELKCSKDTPEKEYREKYLGYDKDEADSYIDTLQNEIDIYKEKYKQEYDIAVANEKQLSLMRVALRKTKYKRCVAIRQALIFQYKMRLNSEDYKFNKARFFGKWEKIWSQLADHFKKEI